jgi:hypothetical protein
MFCSIKLDLMYTNIIADVRRGCDTFGEWRIRINIVPNGTDTHTSPFVRAMNRTNWIVRYTVRLTISRDQHTINQAYLSWSMLVKVRQTWSVACSDKSTTPSLLLLLTRAATSNTISDRSFWCRSERRRLSMIFDWAASPFIQGFIRYNVAGLKDWVRSLILIILHDEEDNEKHFRVFLL